MAHLILASSSPRRRELLQQLGLNFEIYSPDIDESVHDGELVHQYVERLAREKAQAVLNIFPVFLFRKVGKGTATEKDTVGLKT